MVLFILGGIWFFSHLLISKILEFAEDILAMLDDDKQRPSGDMIRKHLCIPCSVALEPRSYYCHHLKHWLMGRGSGVKRPTSDG